jgi:hypothetical protein
LCVGGDAFEHAGLSGHVGKSFYTEVESEKFKVERSGRRKNLTRRALRTQRAQRRSKKVRD